MIAPTPDPLLQAVGSRLRQKRLARDLTQKELSDLTGLSLRFLAQVEAGRGNIALTRLATLARALDIPLEDLVADLPPSGAECGVVALLGLRGAGKSTLGRELALRLGVPFIEHDTLIEEAAGMARGEIFSIHGEGYYTSLARRTLDRLLADPSAAMVLATTGSVVTDPESFEQLQRHARTIWLKADSDSHWERVVAQGDYRPMDDRPDARAELDRILDRRTPLYSRARHTIDTASLGRKGSLELLYSIAMAE